MSPPYSLGALNLGFVEEVRNRFVMSRHLAWRPAIPLLGFEGLDGVHPAGPAGRHIRSHQSHDGKD